MIETQLINERARTRAQQGAIDNLADVYQEWVETHPQEVVNLNNGTSTDESESETAAAEDTGSSEVAGETVSDEDEPADSSPEPDAAPASAPAETPEQTADPAIETEPPAATVE